MYYKAKGIVLHTIKYSETSVIAKIYTDRFGLLSFMVKGVRHAKAKSKAGLMQPLTLLQMEINYRENRSLQFMKEFSRALNYRSLPFDTLKSALALFVLEVVIRSVREQEPNEEVFDFIYSLLRHVDSAEALPPDFPLFFLLHFTRCVGFEPSDNFNEGRKYFDLQEGLFVASAPATPYVLSERESALWHRLLSTNLFQTQSVITLRSERQQMLRNLIKFYQLHIDNFTLHSPDILEEVLH